MDDEKKSHNTQSTSHDQAQTEQHAPHNEQFQQVEPWKEQFLRVSADFQNFKKRSEKERLELAERSHLKVIEKLLPLLDDLERALQAREGLEFNEQLESWVEGFEIIEKNLKRFLADLKIEEVVCTGQFNPRFHEVLMQVQSAQHKPGEIVAVLAKGYRIGDYVIRPAKVSVAA